jgi:hypothetical protein
MKKLLSALALALTATLSAQAGYLDLGHTAGYTPYDPYMQPVKQVLNHLEGEGTAMRDVRAYMREGRNFRYAFTRPYLASLPEETQARRMGDCKDKALWLADRIGDENIRFVVGKARSTSRMSHAWLLWKNEGRWWILDCTHNSRPIAADTVSSSEYIPLYSWSKSKTYRHASTSMFASRAVAGRAPVAGR